MWTCRLAIFFAWGKLKKPLPIKGLCELAARAVLLAKPRRALLGPSFTSCRLAKVAACVDVVRAGRAAPDGPADRAAESPVRWRGLPGVLWPCRSGALCGLPAVLRLPSARVVLLG